MPRLPTPAPKPPAADGASPAPRVLLVTARPSRFSGLGRQLEALGCESLLAGPGERPSGAVDLLLVDAHVPDEALDHVLPATVPAVLVSHDEGSLRLPAVFDAVLYWPCMREELQGLVRRTLAAAERTAGERLRAAEAAAGLATWEWRPREGLRRVSPRLLRLLDLPLSASAPEVLDCVPPSDRRRLEDQLQLAVRARTPFSLEHSVQSRSGELRLLRHHGTVERGADGCVRVVGAARDVTDERQNERRIFSLSNFDPLTELPNAVLLSEQLRLATQLARRGRTSLALLTLDIDDFKRVNNALGFDGGNRLLCELAARLGQLRLVEGSPRSMATRTGIFGSGSTVARLTGDRFAILVGGFRDRGSAYRFARDVVDIVAEPFQIDEARHFITASVGVVLFPDDCEQPEELLQFAEEALNVAKSQGGNRACEFHPELRAGALSRSRLINDLHEAVRGDALEVHFQPKVTAGTRRTAGLEALVRWRHPAHGYVSPDVFVPLAEESGLILQIGASIMRKACEAAVGWQRAGLPPVSVAVNVSSRQLADDDVPRVVEQSIAASGLPPSLLELELTESTLIELDPGAHDALARLKSQGVRLALDDFGTGYSSLAYLRRFRVDAIKLDRAFVEDIDQDEDAAAVAGAVVAMAKSLRLAVVAEGVESEAQARALAALGCDELQGFLFGRAAPIEELIRAASRAA